MLEQRIQQQFFDSADLLNQAAEPLARPVAEALDAMFGALTGGGKLLVAGGALAPHAAALFIEGFERARPPLPALALPAEHAALTALRALGQPGDVLLLLDDGHPTSDLRALAEAAQAQDMTVVGFGNSAPAWADALGETDVLVAVPHERPARVREVHLLLLHALADAIDLQLMGEQEST